MVYSIWAGDTNKYHSECEVKEHFSMKRRVIKKYEKTGFTLQNFPNMEDHFTFMEEHYKNHDLTAFLRF